MNKGTEGWTRLTMTTIMMVVKVASSLFPPCAAFNSILFRPVPSPRYTRTTIHIQTRAAVDRIAVAVYPP